MENISLSKGKKVYFFSDCHLGVPDYDNSRQREAKIVKWLDSIKNDAQVIFLMGDIFDFWVEYKYVVPKGYTRLFGMLSSLSDMGIELKYFTGNHDLWIKDYFIKEIGMKLYKTAELFTINNKKFYLGHGDGIGKGDYGYKFLKSMFHCNINQFFFRMLHPYLALKLGNFLSETSKEYKSDDIVYNKKENERMQAFIQEQLKTASIDYFIFGHRHLPQDIRIENSRHIHTGDWLKHFSYVTFDGNDLKLDTFTE